MNVKFLMLFQEILLNQMDHKELMVMVMHLQIVYIIIQVNQINDHHEDVLEKFLLYVMHELMNVEFVFVYLHHNQINKYYLFH